MNSMLLTLLMGILRNMPQIAAEVEAAVKEAESSDAGMAKAKAILQDVIKFLGTIVDAL